MPKPKKQKRKIKISKTFYDPFRESYEGKVLKKLDKIIELLKPNPELVRLVLNDLDVKDLIKLEMKSHYTARYLYEECKKLFPCWMYDESQLDKITSDRKGDYTVYFKNVQEADEENKNL